MERQTHDDIIIRLEKLERGVESLDQRLRQVERAKAYSWPAEPVEPPPFIPGARPEPVAPKSAPAGPPPRPRPNWPPPPPTPSAPPSEQRDAEYFIGANILP